MKYSFIMVWRGSGRRKTRECENERPFCGFGVGVDVEGGEYVSEFARV